MNRIKLIVVDDHQVLIDGLKALFENSETINICGEALMGKEAIQKATEEDFDVMLLDINLPDISGFEVCKALKTEKESLKIIALTMHNEAGYISKMVKAGVDGYILKNAGKEEMELAISTVMQGKRFVSQAATESLIDGMHQPRKPKSSDFIQKLTRREKEILQLIIEELTTEEIADKLFIGKTTVISHRKSLLRKLNAKNTAGLVKAAYEFGLLKEEN